ncbi:MAG: DUF3307 domain-containing protein [Bacteroidales bacterium]
MMLFLKILLAHLVGDFILQPGSWVSDKNRRKIKSAKLFIHTGVHTILLALVLEFNLYYWKAFILIIISHFIIDLAKSWLSNKRPGTELFFLDQAAHIAIIAIATSFYQPFELNISGLLSGSNLILITALVFVTFAAAVIVKASISQWNPVKISEENGSLSSAGRFIGILERLFVFYFIVSGQWQAIGFLLAAKSIFRFGDLKESKDRKLTEYILIGTLLSFGIAILTATIYLQLIRNSEGL